MLSIRQDKMINNINSIINVIIGSKSRYRILISSNPFKYSIYIRIINLKTNELIYNDMMFVNESDRIFVIDTLRNSFIAKGALVSRLYDLQDDSHIRYGQQGIFLDNLEMIIKISSKLEEINAIKAHFSILKRDVKQTQKKLSN